MTQSKAIAPLSKVELTVAVHHKNAEDATELAKDKFAFIYGIGIQGLTEFEMALADKMAGDHISIPVTEKRPLALFEHLWPSLTQVIQADPPFILRVTITSVTEASNRELVKALAQKTEIADCGCGCGGGCG